MNTQERRRRIEELQKELLELKSLENDENIKNASHLVGMCFKKNADNYRMITGIESVRSGKVVYWAVNVWWQKSKHNEYWLTSVETGSRYEGAIDEIEKNTIPYSRFKKKLLECTQHLNEMADKIVSQNDSSSS